MDSRLRLGSIALPLLLASLACGPDTWNLQAAAAAAGRQSIINGYECTADEMESAVAILVDAEVDFYGQVTPLKSVICTGTLIAPDVVMAAGHCFDPAALTMGMGTVTRADYYISFATDMAALAIQQTTDFPEDAAPGAAFVVNPEFSLDNMNNVNGPGDYKDISLLFLVDPVTSVKPEVVITADEASQIVTDAAVQIAGWGQQTQTDGYNPPPAGTVGIKNCADSTITELGDWELVVGGDSSTSRKCHGDSGGPTYLTVDTPHARTRRVIGVTSHAYDETDCARGGVDTRADVWLAWIDQEMQKACNDGSRSWCEVKGIIPPEHFDPPPATDAGTSADDSDNPLEQLGCGCTASAGASTDLALFALIGLGLLKRRSRG
jgi:hypothetical protein